jgi:hypothetical protein
MKAVLDAIQDRAGATDPGLSKLLSKVFNWPPELIDRSALGVAMEELDPDGDAWFAAEKLGSEKVVKHMLARREALYNSVKGVIKSLVFGGGYA